MDSRVQKIIVLMKGNPRCALALREMASTVNLSVTRLRLMFKAATGMSPTQYFKSLKMQEAKSLLQKSGGKTLKRLLSLSLAAILFLAVSSIPCNLRASMKAAQEVPKAATIKVVLLNAPGINDKGSRWEIAYEFRIANEITLWEAWKQRKSDGGSEQRVGDFIKEGVFRKSLRSPKNREAIFHIPFSPEIQEKLRNQPRERVKTTPGKITPEEIKLLKEREIKSQVFMFYPVINIYDAKLKRNFIISYPQSWGFEKYPQAQFEIKVEINSDGSYSVKSPVTAKKSSD